MIFSVIRCRMYKQNLLEMVSGLVNRAEEAIQGSGMGTEKKAIVIAQTRTPWPLAEKLSGRTGTAGLPCSPG